MTTLSTYLERFKRVDALEHLSVEALVSQAQSGDRRSMEAIMARMVGFVLKLARRYTRDPEELPDYMEEGFLGVMRAVQRFELSRGFKFSTYSASWIRFMIGGYAMAQANIAHVPTAQRKEVRKVRSAFAREMKMHGDVDRAAEAVALAEGTSKHRIRGLIQLAQAPVSLDAPVSESDDRELGALLDDEAPDLGELVENARMKTRLDQALAVLTERERDLVIRHYGLHESDPTSFADLGREKGCSRQAMQIATSKALKKMRAHLGDDVGMLAVG